MALVQSALEFVAEKRRNRLAVADAFDEGLGDAHARRREVDAEQVPLACCRMRQIRVAQHRCRARLRQRRRVHEAAIVGALKHGPARRATQRQRERIRRDGRPGGPVGRQVLDPSIAAEIQAGRLLHAAHLFETLRIQRGDPGVEPVRAQIDVLGEQPFQPRRRNGRQGGDRIVRVGDDLERSPGNGVTIAARADSWTHLPSGVETADRPSGAAFTVR